MGVAAKLANDTGIGARRQIISHHRRSPAKEAEGRGRHQLVLQRDQRGNPPADRGLQQRNRIALGDLQLAMRLPGKLFAPRLAQGAALLRSQVLLHRAHHSEKSLPTIHGREIHRKFTEFTLGIRSWSVASGRARNQDRAPTAAAKPGPTWNCPRVSEGIWEWSASAIRL